LPGQASSEEMLVHFAYVVMYRQCKHLEVSHNRMAVVNWLLQVLSKASLQYPDVTWHRFEPSDSTLVAFYAGEQVNREYQLNMAHAQTFQQYWQNFLANGCLQPELQPQVSGVDVI